MPDLIVNIVRFVDEAQPGVVEGVMTDAWGSAHAFIDKVPLFTETQLTERSSYPQPGLIACGIIRRWRDSDGREITTVDTLWGVESTEGQTRFDVRTSQLTGL
jgi:hypothetical protein